MKDIVELLRASDPEEIWTGRGGLFARAADEIVRLRDEVASLRIETPKVHPLEGTAEARQDPAAINAILRKHGLIP